MTKLLTSVGRAAIVAVALVAILAGCGGGGERQASPTAGTSSKAAEQSLTDLASVDQFAALFNKKQGVPRLVVLLSPT